MDIPSILIGIRSRMDITQERFAQILGMSFVSVDRWERGASTPSPSQIYKILELDVATRDPWKVKALLQSSSNTFASRGAPRHMSQATLFDEIQPNRW